MHTENTLNNTIEFYHTTKCDTGGKNTKKNSKLIRYQH